MTKVKVGIIGGAGYTGGELIRILINHPNVEIIFVHSRSHAGALLSSIHTDLFGDTLLAFTDNLSFEVDLIFLCIGHGESKEIISKIDGRVRIIDLSQDFRLESHEQRTFIYGLPELNRQAIKNAKNIANPGCFATAIQLALLPLAENKLLESEIIISCTTGSAGAGKALTESSHFSWRQNNLSVYKAFTHQHLGEITKNLKQVQTTFNKNILMFPQRGSFTRGILACLNLKSSKSEKELKTLYSDFYKDHPFVYLSEQNVNLKQVINTNKCLLYLEKSNDDLMIISIIDNLIKGASGQAVQNMNLLFGFEETSGLKLKATAF